MTSAIILAGIGYGAVPALASQQGVIATKKWQIMDKCAREAQMAFPDFTPEANVKRDDKLKECLEGNNMPPREPMSTHP
ncbi:MAG: hypothetical protein JO001_12055 [Alphaproteobacteria bacterium]|nr:hypothetical protein [Alphaproteobacteria bacterium]